MTLYKFPGFYSSCFSYGTFWVLSSCSILQDVRSLKATNMTSHKRDKCNVLTGHGSFLSSVQKTFTSTSPHFHNLKNICTYTHTHTSLIVVWLQLSEKKNPMLFSLLNHILLHSEITIQRSTKQLQRGIT